MFLFLLIPLGLRQVDLLYDVFEPDNADIAPNVLIWVGFFGAELTKSVPFVDWSEVFHVANGSPIKPRETSEFPALGAQLVFGLRATLDLLLLAAVLQALSIAARRRETEEAWEAGHLPLRDPFDERLVFEEATATREGWPAGARSISLGSRGFRTTSRSGSKRSCAGRSGMAAAARRRCSAAPRRRRRR